MTAIAGPHHSSSMIQQNGFRDYFKITLGTAPMGKAALAQEGAEVADWLCRTSVHKRRRGSA